MSDDILVLLKRDHEAAASLLQRFDSVPAAGLDDYFWEVVHTLVGHEVAEELVVYPVVRKEGVTGEGVTEARLAEQSQAEQLLADLESQDRSSDDFTTKFLQLREAVLAHAQAEELTAFPVLEKAANFEQRQELGDRYVKAKDRAPTHPHPRAPDTPPANKLIGPVAALFDRARDALHRV